MQAVVTALQITYSLMELFLVSSWADWVEPSPVISLHTFAAPPKLINS